MNILSLNCRGLGLDATVGELRDLIRSYNLAVVFLCETKKKAKAMERIKWSLGFRNGVAVDCNGKSGGLALWWRDEVEVSVRWWCEYFLDAKIHFGGSSGGSLGSMVNHALNCDRKHGTFFGSFELKTTFRGCVQETSTRYSDKMNSSEEMFVELLKWRDSETASPTAGWRIWASRGMHIPGVTEERGPQMCRPDWIELQVMLDSGVCFQPPGWSM